MRIYAYSLGGGQPPKVTCVVGLLYYTDFLFVKQIFYRSRQFFPLCRFCPYNENEPRGSTLPFFMLIRLKIPAFYGKIRFLLLFSFTSLWYYKM